ncbi:MAG: zinc ABC transporter substrate-binding protein [Acidobacteria bacterium]|nr:zinc ABC transporter substrate-binding protein [Acidobacteriota bacterium]
MTRRLVGIVLGTVALALVGAASHGMGSEPLEVVVSILPQQEILHRIGGSEVSVTVLILPGRSPATFEPSPRLMASVLGNDLLLPLGLPFERTVIARIHDLEPDLPICHGSPTVVMEAGSSTAEATHHDHQDRQGHDHSEGPDPHFWLDPHLTIEYAQQVSRCLCRARPQACDTFYANLATYTEALETADRRIAIQLAPFSGQSLFVFHPAFGHFAQRYGLHQVAIEYEGKNPTGRHLAEVINSAKAQGVGVIFVQPQFAGTGAKAVAGAIDADLIELDPLAPDLLANLERIAARIARAFEEHGDTTP